MRARSRLNVRVWVVVAVGALVVAGGVALLLGNTVALRNSSQSAKHTNDYLLNVVKLERLVIDAETGLRGDVIARKPLFLQPLYHAQTQLPTAIAAVEHSGASDPALRQRSVALVAAVRSYMFAYVERVLTLISRDPRAARSFAVTLLGKRLVDGIRADVGELEGLLSHSETALAGAARDTANRSIAEAIAVLILLTMLTGAIGAYLGRLVLARERARERSEELTRTLQQSILPAAIPEIPGCELATRFIPGAGDVSGDFYDVLRVGPSEWALIIGDVCGKGAPAAAATAMARWTLRSSLFQNATPAEALRLLNSVMLGRSGDGQFITASCIRLSLEGELARAVIACAGHPAPVLVPAGGASAAVAAEGDLLGILPAIRLATADAELRPGDSLVAYTDGVTDQGPELRRSPAQALSEHSAGAGARELVGIVEALASHPVGRHRDDIAILALRFLGHGADEAPLLASAEAGVRDA